jgi:iron(III) transport system substrate-binding protein
LATFVLLGQGLVATPATAGTLSSVTADAQIAQTSSMAKNSRLQAIIDGARKEGRLSLVVGQGTFGGTNTRLINGFNRHYGLNIDIQFTPGPSMPRMAATVVQEFKAGRKAITDVITGYANHMTVLISAGAVQPVDWANWAPNIQGRDIVSKDGAAVAFMSSTPGIAYNSNALKGKDIPRSLQDLLRPELKGRVASTPYAAGFDRLGTDYLWGKKRTVDFARKLSKQISGLIRCSEMERLANGEFDVFGLTCSQSNALMPASKGAPIGFTLASDAPIVMYLYEAVPTTSAHPNAAKLWVNYLLSKEAQKILYETSFQDLHLLDGSKTRKTVDALRTKGAKFLLVDTEFYQKHNAKALRKFNKGIQKILGRK